MSSDKFRVDKRTERRMELDLSLDYIIEPFDGGRLSELPEFVDVENLSKSLKIKKNKLDELLKKYEIPVTQTPIKTKNLKGLFFNNRNYDYNISGTDFDRFIELYVGDLTPASSELDSNKLLELGVSNELIVQLSVSRNLRDIDSYDSSVASVLCAVINSIRENSLKYISMKVGLEKRINGLVEDLQKYAKNSDVLDLITTSARYEAEQNRTNQNIGRRLNQHADNVGELTAKIIELSQCADIINADLSEVDRNIVEEKAARLSSAIRLYSMIFENRDRIETVDLEVKDNNLLLQTLRELANIRGVELRDVQSDVVGVSGRVRVAEIVARNLGLEQELTDERLSVSELDILEARDRLNGANSAIINLQDKMRRGELRQSDAEERFDRIEEIQHFGEDLYELGTYILGSYTEKKKPGVIPKLEKKLKRLLRLSKKRLSGQIESGDAELKAELVTFAKNTGEIFEDAIERIDAVETDTIKLKSDFTGLVSRVDAAEYGLRDVGILLTSVGNHDARLTAAENVIALRRTLPAMSTLADLENLLELSDEENKTITTDELRDKMFVLDGDVSRLKVEGKLQGNTNYRITDAYRAAVLIHEERASRLFNVFRYKSKDDKLTIDELVKLRVPRNWFDSTATKASKEEVMGNISRASEIFEKFEAKYANVKIQYDFGIIPAWYAVDKAVERKFIESDSSYKALAFTNKQLDEIKRKRFFGILDSFKPSELLNARIERNEQLAHAFSMGTSYGNEDLETVAKTHDLTDKEIELIRVHYKPQNGYDAGGFSTSGVLKRVMLPELERLFKSFNIELNRKLDVLKS